MSKTLTHKQQQIFLSFMPVNANISVNG